MVWRGLAWFGVVWVVWCGLVWFGVVWCGLVRVVVWSCVVMCGPVWFEVCVICDYVHFCVRG